MKATKRKLILAGLSMLLAVTMLVSASFAWFTISTAPEVSGMQVSLFTNHTLLLSRDTEEKHFQQYITLSEDFMHLAPLRPVSTVDGVNWFIPTYYSATGELKDTSLFIRDTSYEYANVSILAEGLDSDGENMNLTGAALREISGKGYYVYADFWMMTEDDEGCRVRLSVPGTDQLDDSETSNGAYGTYVLPNYTLSERQLVVSTTNLNLENSPEPGTENMSPTSLDSDHITTVTEAYAELISKSAESSMRVGFLVNPTMDVIRQEDPLSTESNIVIPDADHSDYYPDNDFFIYEPNAEKRSAANKPLSTSDNEEVDYVVGYRFNRELYQENYYFETMPIGVVETTVNGTPTNLYKPVVINPEKLAIQLSSQWDMEKLYVRLANGQIVNSNQVQYPMGYFLDTKKVYASLTDFETAGLDPQEASATNLNRYEEAINKMPADISGSNVIVTLIKGEPVKVRMFVWLEGQDVDCWNDIASGGFFVNLELAGETIID